MLTSSDIVHFVLLKVRLNESFEIIRHEFGVINQYASQVFTELCLLLSWIKVAPLFVHQAYKKV